MGSNFHTPWMDGTQKFEDSSLNPVPSALDKAITYKDINKIVHCDDIIHYDKISGVLTWDGVLSIVFTREDGTININTVTANNVTLADNQFVYLDLSETDSYNHSNLSVATLPAVDAVSTLGIGSSYKRLVLAYRNTASNELFPVNLPYFPAIEGYLTAEDITADMVIGSDGHRMAYDALPDLPQYNVICGDATGRPVACSSLLFSDLKSGVYTPTLTNVANLDASTAYQCQYVQIYSTVIVSGKVAVDPTLAATSTRLGISLPVASNIGAEEDCGGTAFASGIAGQGAAIMGDAANDRAEMKWISGDITNQTMFFTFMYRVI